MESNQQLIQNLKSYKKSETSDCILRWETRHNTESMNQKIQDRQSAILFYDFQALASIITERFDTLNNRCVADMLP